MWKRVVAESRGALPGKGRIADLALRGSPCTGWHVAAAGLAGPYTVGCRACSGTSASAGAGKKTRLSAYFERCGATWGEASDVHDVVVSEDKQNVSWRVDLPKDRLEALRSGDALESPLFDLGHGRRGRFQVFPKGDRDCKAPGMCSVWLISDSQEQAGAPHLRVGDFAREGGASEFCLLEEALRDGQLEVGLRLDGAQTEEAQGITQTAVQHSLRLTGLRVAEWCIYRSKERHRSGEVVSSPPFRLHHVLLGDMYLEFLPSVPHEGHGTLLFRCRVPTMKLRVTLAAGEAFSKTFVASGRATPKEDIAAGNFLAVNLAAPGVLSSEGTLSVRCTLEDVVSIPGPLRDMIPKLDERALWPKRL